MRRTIFLLLAFLQPALALAQPGSGFRLLQMDDRPVKWGSQYLGGGATITYALVTTAISFEDARNCRNLGPIDGLLSRSGVDRPSFNAQLAGALAMWESAANVTFAKATDPTTADVFIGVDLDSLGSAHADVLPDPTPGLVGRIKRGLVCLNANQQWKVGFGGDPGAQDLRYTLAHEIGHAIGLNHPSPSGQLMSFKYGEAFAELQTGDVAGASTLYGPPARPTIAGLSGPAAP